MLSAFFVLPSYADGAAVSYISSFDSEEEQASPFAVANGAAYPVTFEKGMGGKSYNDSSMKLTAAVSAASSEQTASFEVPYYTSRWNSDNARTLEASLLYGGDADGARLSCCMYTYAFNDRSHIAVYTIAEIKDGAVYVLGNDTGIKCGKDEWLHIAVEEHKENISLLKIYINGRLIETGLSSGHAIYGNRWTQAMAYFNEGSMGKGYIALDDVAIYEGEYEAMAHGGYISDGIEMRVNGSVSERFAQSGDVLSAKTAAFGKSGTQGALLAAVYNGDKLSDIKYDVRTYAGSTEFAVSHTAENDNSEVRVSFIESLQTMHPNGSAERFVKAPAFSGDVYCNYRIGSKDDMTFFVNSNSNSIAYASEDENGFVKMTKTSDNSLYVYAETGRTAQNVVISADVRINVSSQTLEYIIGDALSGAGNIYSGLISISGGKVSGADLSLGKWHTVSAAIDLTAKKYTVYLDGEKLAESKALPNKEFSYLNQFRLYCPESSERGSIDIDNIRVYEANEPKDIGNAEPIQFNRFDAVDSAKIYLKDKKAVQTYAGTYSVGGVKKTLAKECINYGDESLLPKEVFEWLFDKTVTVSDGKITVEDGSVFNVGSRMLTLPSGRVIVVSAAPEIHDGIVYIPADRYGCAMFPNTFVNDGHGMLIIGSGISNGDARLKAANLYLFFDRKTPQQLKTQLAAGGGLSRHPRLMVTKDDVTRIKNARKTNTYIKKWYQKLKARGDAMLSTTPYTYRLVNGSLRNTAVSASDRIETLSFLYLITGQSAYANRAVKEMDAVLSFPDWTPDQFLETSTLATAAALGYDWLYKYLSAEQRQTYAEKIQQLSVNRARLAYDGKAPFDDFWVNTETNWGIIANGGVANAILATAEYNTDECMQTLNYALRAMEYTWYRLAPDGAWHEGIGYWAYMLGHMAKFMSCYRIAMGEGFAENYRGLDRYGYFQCYMMGPDGLPNNFHDADCENVQSEGQFFLASVYGDSELMRYRRTQMDKYDIEPLVQDLIWYDTSLSDETAEIRFDNISYFRETELVSMREGWNDENASWLSFHGGTLSGAHDHIDAGTFVYAIGGERWAIDLGKDPLRYAADNPAINAGYSVREFYRARAEGHNCVVLNPGIKPEMDLYSVSKASEPITRTDSVYSTVDLSAAYAANASSYRRGFRMTDNMRTLTVRDEISLKGSTKLYWFMHTDGAIEIIDNETALITKNGKKLKVRILTNAPGCTLTAEKAESLPTSPKFNMTENTGVTKLSLHTEKASGDVSITVKMALVGESGSETAVDTSPISEW